MADFLRLLEYAKPYRRRLYWALVAMSVYAASQAGFNYIVKEIIDRVLSKGEGLAQVIVFVLALSLARGIGGYISALLMTQVGQSVVRDLRERFFGHILRQSAAFFSRQAVGQLLSRLTNDIAQIQRAVSETTGDLVRESLTLIGIVAWMFYLEWRLALVCLVTAPLIVYPLNRLGRRVRGQTRRSQEQLEHLTHIATEAMAGHRIVKAFGAEARETRRFGDASAKLYRTYVRVTSVVAALAPITEFVGGLAVAALLWYGHSKIATGELTVGGFMSFLTAALLMYQPIKRLSGANASVQQALAASTRIFEMLDRHTEVAEVANAPALAPLARDVEFRNVGFAYEDDPSKFVVRSVSFTVPKGQVVALVGLSGSGKTTLVNLIPRFFDPTEGAVLIDGVDIRSVGLASLRDQIALVTQETVLFDDTVATNIAYGRPDAPRAAIEAAARTAHAHEFISALPQGYDTNIGERGQRLSGGQRQRLAIARALVSDSPILILDEATSSLDAESEALVADALQALMANRTTFVIAHRLSTIRRADRIIALEKGRVMESGTHDELVDRPKGVYARLYALQMFDDRDPSALADGGDKE